MHSLHEECQSQHMGLHSGGQGLRWRAPNKDNMLLGNLQACKQMRLLAVLAYVMPRVLKGCGIVIIEDHHITECLGLTNAKVELGQKD